MPGSPVCFTCLSPFADAGAGLETGPAGCRWLLTRAGLTLRLWDFKILDAYFPRFTSQLHPSLSGRRRLKKTERLSPAAARGYAVVTAESWEDKIHNAELRAHAFSFFSLHAEQDQHCEFTGLHGVEPV